MPKRSYAKIKSSSRKKSTGRKMRVGAAPPRISNTSAGIRIKHREYLNDVNSTTLFNTLQYSLQPGNEDTFPWLSGVASNFQQYKFHGLLVEFVSTSANALSSVNTALGTVCLSTQYNAALPPPVSKEVIMNSEYSTSGKPSSNLLHLIETDPTESVGRGMLYIRTGDLPAGQDIRFYDLGNTFLSTVGSQAVANIGEIHVSYDIEFFKPILTGSLNQTCHFAMLAQDDAVPLGTGAGNDEVYNNMGVTHDGKNIFFPPGTSGNFLINWTYGSSSILSVMTKPTISAITSGVSLIPNIFCNGSDNQWGSMPGATGDHLLVLGTIKINSSTPAQQVVQLSSFTSGVGNWVCGDLIITQLPAAWA
jgi:hypothetical protein